jgi:hypothetical protein
MIIVHQRNKKEYLIIMADNFFGTFTSFFDDYNGDPDIKVAQDRYEVYVNGDYVGRKTLLAQNDDISDVDDFLHQEGFTEFSSELTGDHYNINANDNANREQIKDYLNLYLKIR